MASSVTALPSRPPPAFRQFVLKISSRCNLACTYCYVYHAADQSWREQPMVMDDGTVRQISRRIAAHAERHAVERVWVTLHGGEPLMVGHRGLARIVEILRSGVGGPEVLEIGVQTNGVLLDERFADYLLDQQIRVGVSLDGGRAANDRHRRFAHGGSSYDRVAAAIELMGTDPYRRVLAGVLATVDPANDPVEVFGDLESMRPGRIDFLLPHATWEVPPPAARPGRTVYGDWLVAAFDAWYEAPPVVGVRIFQEIMHALLGGAGTSEAVGLAAPDAITVETDGSIQRTDALKIAYHGAPATGYDVFRHTLDDVLQHPGVLAGASGASGLADACRRCPLLTACGGGLYPHRYRAGRFDNPSVYCHDLARLIEHVRDRIGSDLAARSLSIGGDPTTGDRTEGDRAEGDRTASDRSSQLRPQAGLRAFVPAVRLVGPAGPGR